MGKITLKYSKKEQDYICTQERTSKYKMAKRSVLFRMLSRDVEQELLRVGLDPKSIRITIKESES